MKTKLMFSAAFLTSGFLISSFAGPASMSDYSKEKNPVVEQQPVCDPRWYISIGAGTDFDYQGTDFFNGARALAFGGAVLLDINSHTYDSVYNTNFYRIQGEFGYVLSRHLEVFGMFKYSHADSEITSGSTATVDLKGPVTFVLTDHWGDYSAWGGELGLRYFFLPKEARFRPYVSISGGATAVDDIHLLVVDDTGSTAFDGALYDSSVVGTVALLVGVEVAVSCHFSVGVDAGVRYETKLDGNDSDLIDQGYSTISNVNNAGDRLYCPVTVYGKFRF
ncbi:MAG: hypothetical protein QOE73_419 [Verrucomicrobiota bacterium]|jgi:hypothetical protein